MTSTKRHGIRQAYTAMGLTRSMFAARVDLSPQAVTNIVNGATMSEPASIRIANTLGWTPEEVLAGQRATTADADAA